MKLFRGILVSLIVLSPAVSHAQAGAEYVGNLSTAQALAKKLGSTLPNKVDDQAKTITVVPDPAEQNKYETLPTRNPTSENTNP